MNVLVYANIIKPEDEKSWLDTLRKLTQQGFEVKLLKDTFDQLDQLGKEKLSAQIIELQDNAINEKLDMMLTLGGDGTMIKASAIASKNDIPILGINLGRLGFLSSVEKSKIDAAIKKIAQKKYSIEARSMISIDCNLEIFKTNKHALNDFTIHKRDTSSMMTIHAYINNEYLNTYWADGLIVATPTGSTGYSLACGGPIIFPGSGNFVITPIAPHSLNVRPLVVQDDVTISFEIEGRADNYLCTLDSRYEVITDEYKISIKKSPQNTKLLILEGSNFMSTIRDKLLWGLDKRN